MCASARFRISHVHRVLAYPIHRLQGPSSNAVLYVLTHGYSDFTLLYSRSHTRCMAFGQYSSGFIPDPAAAVYQVSRYQCVNTPLLYHSYFFICRHPKGDDLPVPAYHEHAA